MLILFSFLVLVHENSNEHEQSLRTLENRWQELHNQILQREKNIEQSSIEINKIFTIVIIIIF